jgi:hypothetical protein
VADRVDTGSNTFSAGGVAGAIRLALARMMPWMARLRLVAFVAAIGIVAVMAYRARNSVNLDEIELWWMAPAVPAAMLWWILLARGWSLLVTGRSRRGDVAHWCRTQAVRYLPGGIWAPVSRATLLPGTVPDKLTTVAAENLIALCAAAAIGGIALAANGDLVWLPLALAPLVPPIATRLTGARTRVSTARAIHVSWNDAIAFLSYTAAAVLVQRAVSGETHVLVVVGAAALAWAAGLVVVIAPGGLGIREVSYVALLSGTFTSAQATTAGVGLRAVTVLAELICLVLLGRPDRDLT